MGVTINIREIFLKYCIDPYTSKNFDRLSFVKRAIEELYEKLPGIDSFPIPPSIFPLGERNAFNLGDKYAGVFEEIQNALFRNRSLIGEMAVFYFDVCRSSYFREYAKEQTLLEIEAL